MADVQLLPNADGADEDKNVDDIHDDEIFEFLEGLVEGFRAAYLAKHAGEAGGDAPVESVPFGRKTVQPVAKRGGDDGLGPWQELDSLGKAPARESVTPASASATAPAEARRAEPEERRTPVAAAEKKSVRGGGGGAGGDGGYPGAATAPAPSARGGVFAGGIGGAGAQGQASPSKAVAGSTMDSSAGAFDSVSSLMRLHALRSFFEETCGTVANAFDLMASTALRSKGYSGGGTSEDRLAYMFNEEEFRNILTGMGYGIDATANWWKALFRNIDSDKDGFVSLQDMYDTMVLDLPIIDGADTYNVFFANREERRY